MLLFASVYFLVVCGAGFAVLRLLGVARGLLGLGLAPAVGLALLTVMTNWSMAVGLPLWVSAVLLGAAAIAGVGCALDDARANRNREATWAFALLMLALVTPALIFQVAYGDLGVPVYAGDGSHHVEIVDTLRQGGRWGGWYPAGFHGGAAAFLQLTPWIDSAQGTLAAGVGMTLIGQLAVFGLGLALWRTPLVAAIGTLLTALTARYLYDPHELSVFPMIAGLTLALGLWAIAVQYFESGRACRRWACLGGLLVASLLLTHGTELYTMAVGLLILLAAFWRRVRLRGLTRDLALAVLLAIVLAAPYLPILMSWARAGGATQAGLEYFDEARVSGPDLTSQARFWAATMSSGWLVDAPARITLLGMGAWWALKHHGGRALLALCVAFLLLVTISRYVEAPIVRQLYAVTLPWGVDYRLATLPAALAGLISGGGVVYAASMMRRRREATSDLGALQRGKRALTRCAEKAFVLLTLLSGAAALVLLPYQLKMQARTWVTYSPDDVAAMSWLRSHEQAGDVLANDTIADAGIWAAYKANMAILLPNVLPVKDRSSRERALALLGHPEAAAEAQAAACALGVKYVYRGAAEFQDVPRQLPARAELERSPVLDEVFTSGNAVVFRLSCPA